MSDIIENKKRVRKSPAAKIKIKPPPQLIEKDKDIENARDKLKLLKNKRGRPESDRNIEMSRGEMDEVMNLPDKVIYLNKTKLVGEEHRI